MIGIGMPISHISPYFMTPFLHSTKNLCEIGRFCCGDESATIPVIGPEANTGSRGELAEAFQHVCVRGSVRLTLFCFGLRQASGDSKNANSPRLLYTQRRKQALVPSAASSGSQTNADQTEVAIERKRLAEEQEPSAKEQRFMLNSDWMRRS
jgi:hypothetical protein